MCMALGGRVSEEIFFSRITTGAQDDLQKVLSLYIFCFCEITVHVGNLLMLNLFLLGNCQCVCSSHSIWHERKGW